MHVMNSRWPGQATPNSLRDFTKTTILNSGNKTYPTDNTSTRWPTCLMCRSALPRRIKSTGTHHPSCPWNYYIECENCGYQNNLSKLLGFWHGCSTKCGEQNRVETGIDKRFSRGDRERCTLINAARRYVIHFIVTLINLINVTYAATRAPTNTPPTSITNTFSEDF